MRSQKITFKEKVMFGSCIMWAHLLLIVVLCGIQPAYGAVDWMYNGQAELGKILAREQNKNVAKNVILVIGDGMGVSTISATRAYARQLQNKKEEEILSFEKFPYVAMSKTYSVDFLVPDSASTATAMVSGIKTKTGILGLKSDVSRGNCSLADGNEVTSMLNWAQDKGKSTGVVTTTRITHATPAATYCHTADRDWESNSDLPPEGVEDCEDIASQLITKNPNINVILGGGRTNFLPNMTLDPEYGDEPNATYGRRSDGRNLVQEWMDEKAGRGVKYSYVWKEDDFKNVNPSKTDYLFGLFEPGHMQFELQREEKDKSGEPSLVDMTEKAIRILNRNKKGYFLLIEGGRIDHAHHKTWPKLALHETWTLANAVNKAMELTSEEDTLIIVTADHSHVMTIAGYPTYENDILGLVDTQLSLDNEPYLTLSYTNGPNADFANYSELEIDFHDPEYSRPSSVRLSSETHAGEDVVIYAQGPMAHLFSGVQEQSYIAHAMAYAACVGPNQEHCKATNHGGTTSHVSWNLTFNMAVVLILLTYHW